MSDYSSHNAVKYDNNTNINITIIVNPSDPS